MVFWTWARSLEDEFDGKNRKNPRHFLVSRPPSARPQSPLGDPEKQAPGADNDPPILEVDAASTVPSIMQNTAILNGSHEGALTFIDDVTREEMNVVRIPTCAVFHKITSGRGVPHAFYGFIKQMPALPRLVVSAWSAQK